VAAQDVPANMQVSRKMGIRAYRRFGCGRIRRKLFARKPMIRVCNIVKITNLAFISSPPGSIIKVTADPVKKTFDEQWDDPFARKGLGSYDDAEIL
jgi:hypothetical protein